MLLVWGAILLVFRPPALDPDALRATVTRKLSTWSGGQIAISGPMRIRYFPIMAVETEGVLISAPDRIPAVTEIAVEKLRIETGLLDLLWPHADFEKLILEGATVTMPVAGPAADLSPPQKDEFRLLQALKDTPVEWLILRNTRVVTAAGENREGLEQIDADIRLTGGSGAISASGKLNWRGQPATFAVTGDAPQIDKGTAAIPMRLKLETPMLTAALDARATVASGLQLAGRIDLAIPDLGKFARWMGLLLPEDNRSRQFAASARFDWEKDLIGFDDGSFAIDGNRAIGALALKLGEARPLIEGTLAFQKLALSSFLPGADSPPKEPAGSPDGFAWMHHVDLDLRISTAALTTPSLEIGQAALSTVLRAGQLDADFAVLDLCGGKANGRFEYNAAVAEGRARLLTNIDDLSAKQCLGSLTGLSPLRGLTKIAADISAEGRDMQSLLRRLSGNISVNLAESEVDLDISKLAALSGEGDLKGWAPLLGRSTPLSAFEAKIVLHGGNAYNNSMKLIAVDKSMLTGEGTVDLISGYVDYHIVITNGPPPSGAVAGGTQEKKPSRLRVSGSWMNPTFRLEHVQSGSSPSDAAERHARTN